MAITRVGVASAAGATVTEPAHAAGDILFLFATRDGNATPPTSPGGAGYSAWWDNTANTYGGIFSIKVGTGTPVSVTATNATAIMIVAYRGIQNPNTYTPAIDSSRETGSGTTCTNVALTLASASSGVLAFKATREAASTASAETPPAGMTLVGSVGTTEELALFEILSAGTTSWAPANQTISTTSTGWITVAYEMVPTSTGDSVTVDPGAGSVAGQTINILGDPDVVPIDPGAATGAGQTIWLNVVDNPYPDQPAVSGTPPSGFTWPQNVSGLFETSDGKMAFGQRSDSAVAGDYLDLATHNGDYAYSFTSNGKYVKMETRSGDQYYEDDNTKERSEIGTMRLYSPTNTKYVFEWNSLFDGSANNSAGWCTLAQWHGDSGGSPIIGLYWEGTDFVCITRSGTSGSPTENYRFSLSGGASMPFAYGIYHRFTLTVDWTGGISNASLRLDIDGVNRVNVSGVTIGHTTTTSFRHYWGVYRTEVPETTSHQVKNIRVAVGDTVVIDPATCRVEGQSIDTPSDSAGADTVTVDAGAATLAGQTILETETIAVTNGSAALAGITVGEAEIEVVTVGAGEGSLAGQTIDTPSDSSENTVPVDPGTAALAGQSIDVLDIVPPAPVLSNGGGGGPASDEVYWANKRRQEAKREAHERKWRGTPAEVADRAEKKPAKRAAAKKTATPAPEPVDPLAELLALLAEPEPLLLLEPRPSRVYDPEDDVAVLLLTDL